MSAFVVSVAFQVWLRDPRIGGRFMCRPEMASDQDFNHHRFSTCANL